MRWFDSLQSRLLLGTAVATTAVFIAAGGALYVMVGAELRSDLDNSLRTQVQTIAGMFERSANGDLDLGLDQWPTQRRTQARSYFEVWSAKGTILARSASLGRATILHSPGKFPTPTTLSVTLPGDVDALAVAWTVTPPTDSGEAAEKGKSGEVKSRGASSASGPVTLVIAHGLERIDDTLANLGLWLLVIWLLAIGVEVIVLAWVVRRGLRPAKVLANKVASIDGTDLSQRIDLADAPRELTPIVDRLNDLLERVETAFTHEKAFLGHVAHELRTPLAGLRSTLEVALSKQRQAAAYRRDMEQSLDISRDMQAMVDNLLAMARLDAGQSEAQPNAVGVGDLLEECWQLYAEPAAGKRLHIDWQVDATAAAWIDSHRLRIVLRNLIDNAVSYAGEQGRIRLLVSKQGKHVRVEIANDGCHLAAHDAEQVFERFWRGDPARRGGGGHCGLGLSLCRQIVEQSGGTIVAKCESGGLFQVICHLPAAPDDMGSAGGDGQHIAATDQSLRR